MLANILLAAAIQAQPISLLPVDELRLADHELQFDDFFDLSRLSEKMRKTVSRRVFAEIPASTGDIVVSSASLERWARAVYPKLKVAPSPDRDIALKFSGLALKKSKQKSVSGSACFAASTQIAAHQILNQSNLRTTACRNSKQHLPAYFSRRDKALRASQDISVGDYVGHIGIQRAPLFDRGAELQFVARHGPVEVRRNVKALEVVRDRRSLFVVSEDGQVFATTYKQGDE